MYSYAASAGLSPDSAKGIYNAVYDSVAKSIKSDILSRVYSEDIDPAIAASYAKSMGLQDADVKEIAELALRYQNEYTEFSKSYLDYLESLAAQTNTNYKDP